MRNVRLLLAIGAIIAGVAFSGPSQAVDTTIKVHCTCKDDVGTWKASCYSTNSCTTCCGYKLSRPIQHKKDVVPEMTEIGEGKLGVVGVKDTAPPK